MCDRWQLSGPSGTLSPHAVLAEAANSLSRAMNGNVYRRPSPFRLTGREIPAKSEDSGRADARIGQHTESRARTESM